MDTANSRCCHAMTVGVQQRPLTQNHASNKQARDTLPELAIMQTMQTQQAVA
jgi:hypothetical protein